DFGAARDVSSVANKSLSVMLKPGFAPEEQYRSRGNQGAWTDVYALCATMYACITGVTPDDATQRVFNDEVKRPSEMGVVIGPAVENAIMKGMAVKQEDRFQSVEELISALTGSAPAPARTPVQPKASAPASQKKKGGKGILIALIAILLAAAVGVGAYFIINGEWGGDRDEDTDTTGTSSSGEPGSLNEQNKIEFTLDGEQYALPCAFSDFADKGWGVYTYSDIDSETMIPAMSYTFGSLEKDDKTVSVLVYNDTDDAKAVKDCGIGNMYLDFSRFALVLPEGLSGIPTVDEIITALGDPDLRDDGDGYTSMTYYLDGIQGKYYDFYCDLDDPEYSSLSISNMNTVDFNYVLPEDLEGDATEDTTDTPTDVPDTEPSSEDTTVSTPDEPTVPAVVMSDNLLDFTFKLDGKVYRLPCAYTELTSDGWSISYGGSEDQQIPSRSYVYLTMAKGEAKFTAYVYNLSGNAKTLKDCKVGFIDFHSDAGIELAKGITPLSTREDVIAAFGTPSKEAAYDNYVRLEYTVDGKPDTFVKFYCYTERTELFSRIEIKNFIATESDKTETNSDVPAYLASYVAPAALGDDMSSGIISFGGDLYHLPAPLTEFTDNGWVITAKTNDVASGVTESVKLERDGKSFTVYVKNFADYQTIPENCAVVSLLSYASYDIEMTLPGNIGFGSSAEEVAAAPLPEGITNNDGFYTYYNYTGDENYSLSFRVDKNSGQVSYITITDKNWDH
ncbi:MAG: hypothetical protein IJ519_03350, partial [Clostridia bacterium]|nr:hypothetical protein [Clostridia bacterium]